MQGNRSHLRVWSRVPLCFARGLSDPDVSADCVCSPLRLSLAPGAVEDEFTDKVIVEIFDEPVASVFDPVIVLAAATSSGDHVGEDVRGNGAQAQAHAAYLYP